ncbi:23S ribosomal RNA methyltransferase [Saitoella complicata NRRL Y-17804]|uniref:23S ribosomal RNA methyltransferase n=1 Tax=Saitoella complicata (strain BCRC 22490 / CBS 7301 / JCM 7358 / NBRC 10748 / NRRL Y-17804) TaxID=698492 RepID=UPI000866E8AC|nr:23S ribosomal RNA methyltransferase [Saitoella complicata NRRL Y-17804]ODQ50147.1 23S ribosomal RNA methyltransferase [Saitoella complicata NRRL Y-17804]
MNSSRLLTSLFRQLFTTPARSCQHQQHRAFHATRIILDKGKSGSSKQWLQRQGRDPYNIEAKLKQYKSRAAFKLIEMNDAHKFLRPGITVVDLGFAPGSWTQVAVAKTRPGGSVLGIDVIPAQPPAGASAMQANFLSRRAQIAAKEFFANGANGRASPGGHVQSPELGEAHLAEGSAHREDIFTVNVVLSDMSEPLPLYQGVPHSLKQPYFRMANTTGLTVADHGASMDLCDAALVFCLDALTTGGHFICKFFDGDEAPAFEDRLKKVFEKVEREKPDASRKTSREGYFVAMNKRANLDAKALKKEFWG